MSILVPDLHDRAARPRNWQRTSAAFVSAGAVLLAATAVALGFDAGPQARHMGYHILAMNIVAPVIAGVVVTLCDLGETKPSWLWIATIAQIAAVWIAHAPSVQAAAMALPGIQLAMHGLLLAAALWFWLSILLLSDARRWHALPALLLTGKLVCLLAALLVFAPRALYGEHHHPLAASMLDDQQLAGLIMVVACPLSYLAGAIVITVQLLNRARERDGASLRQPVHGAG